MVLFHYLLFFLVCGRALKATPIWSHIIKFVFTLSLSVQMFAGIFLYICSLKTDFRMYTKEGYTFWFYIKYNELFQYEHAGLFQFRNISYYYILNTCPISLFCFSLSYVDDLYGYSQFSGSITAFMYS